MVLIHALLIPLIFLHKLLFLLFFLQEHITILEQLLSIIKVMLIKHFFTNLLGFMLKFFFSLINSINFDYHPKVNCIVDFMFLLLRDQLQANLTNLLINQFMPEAHQPPLNLLSHVLL